MINSIGNDLSLQQMFLERFTKIDKDEDGSLSKDEFQVLADAMEEETDEAVDFSSVDTNGDEQISFEELNALHEKNMHPMGKGIGNPDKIFNEFDTDGNGTISETEFSRLMAKFSDNSEDDTSDSPPIISSIDTDGNGEISAEELQEYLGNKKPIAPPNFQDAYNSSTENTSTLANTLFNVIG